CSLRSFCEQSKLLIHLYKARVGSSGYSIERRKGSERALCLRASDDQSLASSIAPALRPRSGAVLLGTARSWRGIVPFRRGTRRSANKQAGSRGAEAWLTNKIKASMRQKRWMQSPAPVSQPCALSASAVFAPLRQHVWYDTKVPKTGA